MITIGPLTGEEWASFALIDGDDERNPLPPCCAELSQVRNAIFDTLRSGADPQLTWRRLASVWHVVEEHDGGELVKHPTMTKLYDAYVKGRERPTRGDGFAQLLAKDPAQVRQVIADIPAVFDLSTRQGRIEALTQVGGRFVGYVLDPYQRDMLAVELAQKLDLAYRDVCLAIDVLRVDNKLPYEATCSHQREKAKG